MVRPYALLLLVLALIGTPAAVIAQSSKTVSETVALSHEGRVVVDTYKGSINVTTWDRAEVSIEALIEADENDELVELTEVHIDRSGQTLQIATDYKKAERARKSGLFGTRSLSLPFVHYTIRMPRTAELRIEDYKSDINVADLDADLNLETYKGEVHLDRISGELQIETYKGDVQVTGLDGSLQAETYKGTIEAHFSEFAGNSSVDTYRGEIDLTFPERAGFELDADMGRRGDIDADFDLAALKRGDNRYRGSVLGGGPRLNVETYRGQVQLRTAN
jgi:hypothetical protein